MNVSRHRERSDENPRDEVEVIVQEGTNNETEYNTCKRQSYFMERYVLVLNSVISSEVPRTQRDLQQQKGC